VLEWEDGFDYVDLAHKFELKNNTILKIYCEADINNSKIVIQFKNKKQLILKCIDPTIFDSPCEFILE